MTNNDIRAAMRRMIDKHKRELYPFDPYQIHHLDEKLIIRSGGVHDGSRELWQHYEGAYFLLLHNAMMCRNPCDYYGKYVYGQSSFTCGLLVSLRRGPESTAKCISWHELYHARTKEGVPIYHKVEWI